MTSAWPPTGRPDLHDLWGPLVDHQHDLPALTQLIAWRVVELIGDGCVLTTLNPDGASLHPQAAVHRDPAVAAAMDAVLGAGDAVLGEGIAGSVALERRSVMLNGLSAETIAETTPTHYTAFTEAHLVRALIVVPLIASGELVGTLGAVRTESDEPYTEADLSLLEALGERAALAIATALAGPRSIDGSDFEALYRHNIDGVILGTPDGLILAANPAACVMLGRSERAIIDSGAEGLLVPDDPLASQGHAELVRNGRVRGEIRMRRGDDSVFTAAVSSAIYPTHDQQLRTLVIFRDVTREVTIREALRSRLADLEQIVHRDPLTGLWNREGFVVAAEQALATADRHGMVSQVVFVDVDGLKAINDTRGHAVGDAALLAVGRAIAGATREMDVACRLGGDEFVVLLVDVPADEVAGVLGRVEQALLADPTVTPPVRVSTGVAERPPGDDSPLRQLIEVADRSMYQQKLLTRLRGRSRR